MTRHTPLYEDHVKLGGRMVSFAGWELPVQYSGVIDEHKAVRNAAGIFDVSHMGQIVFTGPDALACVQNLTTNDASKLTDGKAQYSILCNERGTVIDDVIVYRFSENRFMMVVNGSNVDKDFEWCKSHTTGDVKAEDISDSYALIALQGPKAADILSKLTDADLASLPSYSFTEGAIDGKSDCIIARTGYTGEDGFELFCKPEDASAIWQSLIEHGKPLGLLPAGLGARDTLRLEMKFSLYGQEITEETLPIESGLAWVVKMDASDFIGRDAIAAAKEKGLNRKLVGFKMTEKGIPRQGYPIMLNDEEVGVVTSGTMSPSLGEAIGIGFVPKSGVSIGDTISIDIRGRGKKAEIVKTPFYKKQ
jgi:glycine cleavage system T protein (aminomethyltransferase)